MFRLLILLAVLGGGWWLWRRMNQPTSTELPPVAPLANAGAQMVRCRQCGLHVPQSEAVMRGEQAYCCVEHLQKDSH
ncbi:MAG: PP0621 family protein [Pseudomonas sp.]